jgi:hypothetical protein
MNNAAVHAVRRPGRGPARVTLNAPERLHWGILVGPVLSETMTPATETIGFG